MSQLSDFLRICEKANEQMLEMSNPLVVHHYDADGISSGSIVVNFFRSSKKPHRIKWIKKLDNQAIDSMLNEDEVVLVDLGSGNERVDELPNVVVIDHHLSANLNSTNVNANLFGFDGGREISASGTAYLVCGNNVDLAVVGGVGDMQYPFEGINRQILFQGIDSGEVECRTDLRLYGRNTRPLPQFLAYGDEYYIPGITGRPENASEFLRDLGIFDNDGSWPSYEDLSEINKSRLRTALVDRLALSGFFTTAKEIVGEVYLLRNRKLNGSLYDSSEFATLLNACGRHGRADLGLRVCLGEPEAIREADSLLRLHKRMIREGVAYAKKHLLDLGSFYLIDGRGVIDEGIIGIVCGMVGGRRAGKPILGVSFGERGFLKLSTRFDPETVSKGIKAGDVMSVASKEVGGVGGGHSAAAGSNIPEGTLPEFLVLFGHYVRHLPNKTGNF